MPVAPLVLVLISASPVTLSYAGGPDSPPGELMLSRFEPGQVLRVASDGARLRAAPSPSGAPIAALILGARVKIVGSSSAAVRLDQRVDHWYEVELAEGGARGHLFGAVLSPAVWDLDLDDDGETEVVSAVWTWDFKIKVRVLEPALPAGERELSFVVPATGQAYACCGGNATIEPIARKTAGLSLLSVGTRIEACGDYGTSWLSYRSKRRGAAGRLAVAIRTSSLGDPPSYAESKLSFRPKTREAIVVVESWVDDGEGRSEASRSTSRYRLKGGVFVEQAAR